MTKLSDSFEYFLEQYGAPKQAQPLSKERSVELRRHLPHSIVDFWNEYGFGSVLDGLFRFCDPADYKSILALLFKSDKDFNHNDCHVFGYTAFGKLFIWSERHGVCYVNLLDLTMSADEIYEDPRDDDISIGVSVSSLDDDYYDLEDAEDEKPLFKRAVKKLGKLEPGEVYGFRLAPALGGSETLDKLGKYPALEHFAILAQADDLKLMDYSNFQTTFVRVIG